MIYHYTRVACTTFGCNVDRKNFANLLGFLFLFEILTQLSFLITLLKKVTIFGNFMLPKTIIRSRKSVGSPLIETVLKKVSIFGIIILPKMFTVFE